MPIFSLFIILRTLSNGQHVVGILESEKEPGNISQIFDALVLKILKLNLWVWNLLDF